MRDSFPLPHIDEALWAVHNCQWLTSFDLASGYLQTYIQTYIHIYIYTDTSNNMRPTPKIFVILLDWLTPGNSLPCSPSQGLQIYCL